MIKAEIQRQIQQCQREIEIARRDIARLESDRDEHVQLQNQLRARLSELRAKQGNRRGRIAAIRGVSGVSKLARSVSNAFDGAVGGNEFGRATSGLSDAVDRVSKELQSIDSKQEERRRRIRQLEARIAELRAQLSALPAEQAR